MERIQLRLGLVADGNFGPQTDAAVRKYQLDNHLGLVDGIVGPVTWRHLFR